MKESKFKIGDRVKMVSDSICAIGEIMDSMYSTRYDKWLYEVRDLERTFDGTYGEESLELAPAKDFSMDIKIDIANNVVIATLYESVGGVQKPLRKGHGHLIHEGDVGIAQAASYACMRLYKSMGGYER